MVDVSLKIDEQHLETICVLAVAGRIDSSNAGEFAGRLMASFSGDAQAVLLDFAQLNYLTSAGFRVLIVATDEAERRKASLALCSVPPEVRDLFEMGGLLELFRFYGTREEAISDLPR